MPEEPHHATVPTGVALPVVGALFGLAGSFLAVPFTAIATNAASAAKAYLESGAKAVDGPAQGDP